ncbi:MAG TPA: hypothetical protein VJA47_00355, partial [archaeon]|nr:hypothetical protein [archaeon]
YRVPEIRNGKASFGEVWYNTKSSLVRPLRFELRSPAFCTITTEMSQFSSLVPQAGILDQAVHPWISPTLLVNVFNEDWK